MKDKKKLLNDFLINSLEFHEKNMKGKDMDFIINFTGNLLSKLTATLCIACLGEDINTINLFIDQISTNTKKEIESYTKSIKELIITKH